jgi:hypothetical protein
MEKQRWEETEKTKEEERRSEKRKNQRKEDAGARKGRKVMKHCVLPRFCGPRASKSRLATAAGAERSGQMRDQKLQPLWREAHLEVKMLKTHHSGSTFGS